MAAVTGLCAQQAMAQYPQITPEAKAKFEAQRAEWEAHSDSAWQVAFPIVKKEAMEGRPYVPWAWRPYDLKQARYLHSPVLRAAVCTLPADAAARCSS